MLVDVDFMLNFARSVLNNGPRLRRKQNARHPPPSERYHRMPLILNEIDLKGRPGGAVQTIRLQENMTVFQEWPVTIFIRYI